MNLNSRVKLGSSVMDSGLIVVVFIITSLIITVFSFLLFVDYEWCHVLFLNNTENPACTKNDNREKVLLTSSINANDIKEENKRYRETHHQIFNGADSKSDGAGTGGTRAGQRRDR